MSHHPSITIGRMTRRHTIGVITAGLAGELTGPPDAADVTEVWPVLRFRPA